MTLTYGCRVLACALVILSAPFVPAQTNNSACGVAPVVAATSQPNIFTDQQEQWLGDAMADMVEAEYRPARDASQNAHLQALVDRLAATLPQTSIQFRVLLIDSPAINGFSLAGGHIYLTRKLIAAAQNDDELAAVLGHEMGHIASHQFAFETTRDLRRLLGIASVGDRADIYKKFQMLMDARLTDKHPLPGGDSDDKQDEADRIGVYVTAAAGYRPAAAAELWDRVFFVGGKTGSHLSDFFGITQPTQKRLRGMLAMASAMPPGCGGTYVSNAAEFANWHKDVVANQASKTAALTAASARVTLTPPLHMDINHVRFSRDGKLILAQDEGSIFILTRQPLALQFRIDALNAQAADFSPDSSRVVFSTPGMHTEEWSLADRKLIAAHEVFSKNECIQTEITPDGRTLVCLSFNQDNNHMDFALLDVATNDVVWEKKDFFVPSYAFILSIIFARGGDVSRSFMPSSFSADGNTLLVGPSDSKVAFDLRSRTPIKIGGKLKGEVDGAYAFVGNDKVLGVVIVDRKTSGVFSFPDGKQIKAFPVNLNDMESISHAGDDISVITRSVKESEISLVDFTAKRSVGPKVSSMDVWDDTMVTETTGGGIALVKSDGSETHTTRFAQLPLSPLARLQSVTISDDGKYLSLSTRRHGGIWDLATGRELMGTEGFTSSKWMPDGTLFADFPKFGHDERIVTQVDPVTRRSRSVPYKLEDGTYLHYGHFLEWKPGTKNSVDLIAHNLADNATLWTRTFRSGKPIYTGSDGTKNGDLIFSYPLRTDYAKDIVKANPSLAAEVQAIQLKDNGRVIEIVSATTGKTEAMVALELPRDYDGNDNLSRVGDLLYMGLADNRTNVYFIQTGKQLRQVFGYLMAIDPETLRVCIINRGDEALIYDSKGKQIAHYRLGSNIRFAHFRDRGNSLLLLTADQNIRTMDLTKTSDLDVATK